MDGTDSLSGSHKGSEVAIERESVDPEYSELEAEYVKYKANEEEYTQHKPGNNDEKKGRGKNSQRPGSIEVEGEVPRLSYGSIPSFEEEAVTIKEYFDHSVREKLTVRSVGSYFTSLFPIIRWLPHYNFKWAYADLVAGITVGCVLVPQSMSYAQIASLAPQYGLYSSFIGAFIYSLFATSKDVCIGPVAVMSLQTAKVISLVLEKYPEGNTEVTAPIIATTLALLCGIVSFGLGVLRLGFLVELISLNAVAGFMTGSSFNIIWGQVPALMGYNSLVNTRNATYRVVIDSLKHLPDTTLDAVFGLIPLVLLYVWKWWCDKMGPYLADKYYRNDPKKAQILKTCYFYAQALRNAVIIIVFTAISWRITRHKSRSERPISILGTVPSGLRDVGVMKIPEGLLLKMSSDIPSSIIVLVLEHIAISKSFGRLNDYKVVPDQELIAIGVTNLIGTFFHAYPTTGSFSRSALKAKCNVRTPFSGIFTGACVLLALYCLTDAFFFIPKATLSAIIIHAVSDLLASYNTTLTFWKTNPLDGLSFIITVLITVFSSIENGIYFAMCWSAAMLLLKQAFPAGKFLGRVEVVEVLNPTIQTGVSVGHSSVDTQLTPAGSDKQSKDILSSIEIASPSTYRFTNVWVPFDHGYTRELNCGISILQPPSGVLVYRFGDSYTYINCSRHYDIIFDRIKRDTRRGQLVQARNVGDRPWNDPGEWECPKAIKRFFKRGPHDRGDEEVQAVSHPSTNIEEDEKPVLKILCLDFSQVAQVDSTAIQSLVDLRKAVNRYADRQVEFHFAGIISPWIKKGLLSVGFGMVNSEYSDESIIIDHSSYHVAKGKRTEDGYLTDSSEMISTDDTHINIHTVSGTNLPFFHINIPDFSKWDV
ncbi:hypothetical protein HG535_0A08940 [Zygotorulaspora mrakii]|uniref:STAS domain-containing protein n=1 Tax=Zygotorulaspora mrakii TaxID=42260 RepID=A0A7H9AXR6_ZYGMR|nr:uncharacterized protein HG535_0A08940 [Zygotorulaspora mrakii]QLG70947.1 hypothetical protein HG535_0A08940 [Zygotorulaspora mrakii]